MRPIKRTPVRRPRRKSTFRGRKLIKKRSQSMTIPRRNINLFPSRYFTKLKQTITGFIPPMTGTEGFFIVDGNSFSLPFQSIIGGYGLIDIGGTASLITLSNSSSSSNQLNGYTRITSIYQSFRVHASKLSIKCQPASVSDTIELYIVPVSYSVLVDATGPYQPNLSVPQQVPLVDLIAQNYVKHRMITSGSANQKAYTVSCFSKAHNILGLTKRQYNDQLPPTGSAGNLPTNLQTFYYVQYNLLENSAPNTANIVFEIDYESYVECTQPVPNVG
nr:MAG: capsid protein [Cressdnaviricota sp.]